MTRVDPSGMAGFLDWIRTAAAVAASVVGVVVNTISNHNRSLGSTLGDAIYGGLRRWAIKNAGLASAVGKLIPVTRRLIGPSRPSPSTSYSKDYCLTCAENDVATQTRLDDKLIEGYSLMGGSVPPNNENIRGIVHTSSGLIGTGLAISSGGISLGLLSRGMLVASWAYDAKRYGYERMHGDGGGFDFGWNTAWDMVGNLGMGKWGIGIPEPNIGLAMAFKLCQSAEKRRCRLNHSEKLADVIEEVRFVDGIREKRSAA